MHHYLLPEFVWEPCRSLLLILLSLAHCGWQQRLFRGCCLGCCHIIAGGALKLVLRQQAAGDAVQV
jgi:hypothetical protein